MYKETLLLLMLLSALPSLARDKVENWIEVRSPHFVIATNSNEKQARRVADQFERMRSVFHVLFPKLQLDTGSPIIVLAIKDEKDFRALEPAAYLAKGQLKIGGLFLRAPDKNYVLMRLDAEGEHPYEVVYHEYTHFLMAKAEWLPLWLNEGLAEFYQNTDIHEKDISLGQGSLGNLQLLREHKLLPLPALFAVDANSPYYHEENKGSIFYAESWALTHFIHIHDYENKTHRLTDYAELLAKKVDPLTAATTAFGDLKQLERALDGYVQQGRFKFFSLKTSTDVDDAAFKAELLAPTQSEALRADFLAYNQRTGDARSLLDHVFKDDPNNVSAHETMGFLEFREGHLDAAKKWYAQSVQLDSQSYLAHYYFAAISMESSLGPSEEPQVENSLRQSIKLNPLFAPSFDRLAVFLGSRHRDLNEAHMMGLTAVSLDPNNVGYRVNVANILLAMERGQSAVEVLRQAAKLAKSPQEVQWVDDSLMRAQEYAAAQQQLSARKLTEGTTESENTPTDIAADATRVPYLTRRTFAAGGPHRFLIGVLKDIHCDSSNIDLAVKSGARTLNVHSDNYFNIPFTALGFQPTGDLNPCRDLEGKPAKVEYIESADKSVTAQLVSIELHK